MTAKLPSPVTLTGHHIRLEPLARHHLADLWATIGSEPDVWRWTMNLPPATEEELGAILDARIAEGASGESVEFAAVDLASGTAVGVTGYYDLNAKDEYLEIGGTMYARSVWRTAVNTEAKLLLLTHAFEDLGMGRVFWKTDALNERSRNAILRLGAQYEGTFRRHRLRPTGVWRDSVYFSMLADEWPAAKSRLEERLSRG
ncbi:GNAT family N-acetyltransferase [Kitasatospora aureofaciens]|uniref:N-acetyltransferase n=1 Tax=Kitasatospora aureofaciens TaxID=1894 RepID=A0A1E7N3I0_KITAU|nr:GNAT family protein [Kitasatospora aureofaciens]ARF79303.1 N-acetyltransferase [Kitasatospora aureofaciens]OEV35240.1 GNAT family N-acetyltransferase [Kitasatospora aureofaciens]GGU67424.1 N-acetyltransferase [Kitasatospora aureofaciens]